MAAGDGTVHGRGAARNPPNRFEIVPCEPDPDTGEREETAPATRLYRDSTRTIIARNDSPDGGFEYSINPYRGCEHGCAYCLAPETPVLFADMSWRPISDVRPGDLLVGFDEYPRNALTRKLRPAVVQAVWWSRKPTLRPVSRDAEVVTAAEHRWLDARDGRWCRTATFAPGRYLRHTPVIKEEGVDDEYRIGYLSGLSLGDGTF